MWEETPSTMKNFSRYNETNSSFGLSYTAHTQKWAFSLWPGTGLMGHTPEAWDALGS
jgi:hypothetical protein